MDLTNNLSGTVAALPKEIGDVVGPILQSAFDRIDALETKLAAQESDIVTQLDACLGKRIDQLFAGLDARLPSSIPVWTAPKLPNT
jgi:hypothetical protein